MAKVKKGNKNMKRGAAHHWAKAEGDKVAKKPYVPTGGKPGRKKMDPKDLKYQPYVPTGKPRGRKPKAA